MTVEESTDFFKSGAGSMDVVRLLSVILFCSCSSMAFLSTSRRQLSPLFMWCFLLTVYVMRLQTYFMLLHSFIHQAVALLLLSWMHCCYATDGL